jgi:hypothetical protein
MSLRIALESSATRTRRLIERISQAFFGGNRREKT